MTEIILVAVLVGGLFVSFEWVRRSRWYQHRQLFRQLCRLHQLDRSSRRLLQQLSQQLRLPYSAWVFVDPRCLAAARQMPGAPLPQLLHLEQRLFGDQPEQTQQANEPKNTAAN